jgi:hypothetical protein
MRFLGAARHGSWLFLFLLEAEDAFANLNGVPRTQTGCLGNNAIVQVSSPRSFGVLKLVALVPEYDASMDFLDPGIPKQADVARFPAANGGNFFGKD